MSNKLTDETNDYIADHEIELVEEWLQDDGHNKTFEAWLWDKDQDSIRRALFEHFLSCTSDKEVKEFNAWAFDSVYKQFGGD